MSGASSITNTLRSIIFFTEGVTNESLIKFRKNIFVFSSATLLFTLISLILYLWMISAFNNEPLPKILFTTCKWFGAGALLFYIVFSCWSAFRLAATDYEFQFSVSHDDLFPNFYCHAKTFSKYSYVIFSIYFWITICLTEILGRIFKILDLTGETFSGGVFVICTLCLLLFFLIFFTGVIIYFIGRVFGNQWFTKNVSENTGKMIRRIGRFAYFGGLSCLITCCILLIPLYGFIHLTNTEDVTLNCSAVDKLLVKQALDTKVCKGDKPECKNKTRENCDLNKCSWESLIPNNDLQPNGTVSSDTTQPSTPLDTKDDEEGQVGFQNLFGKETIREGMGSNLLAIAGEWLQSNEPEELPKTEQDVMVKEICDKSQLRVEKGAITMVVIFIIFTAFLFLSNLLIALRFDGFDIDKIYANSIDTRKFILLRIMYKFIYKLYKSVSTSFNKILEEQADLTHNQNLKGLSI